MTFGLDWIRFSQVFLIKWELGERSAQTGGSIKGRTLTPETLLDVRESLFHLHLYKVNKLRLELRFKPSAGSFPALNQAPAAP